MIKIVVNEKTIEIEEGFNIFFFKNCSLIFTSTTRFDPPPKKTSQILTGFFCSIFGIFVLRIQKYVPKPYPPKHA